MSSSQRPDGLDDEIREMLRKFEGPEAPGPRRRPASRRRNALTAGAAAVTAGAVALAVWSFTDEGERREAALSRAEPCSELRFDGRRYLPRRVSAGLLRPAGELRRSADLVCPGSPTRRTRVLGVAGIEASAGLARAASPGIVYVAAASGCLDARPQAKLVTCLKAQE